MLKCSECKKKKAIGYFWIKPKKQIPLCKECKIKIQIELFRGCSK